MMPDMGILLAELFGYLLFEPEKRLQLMTELDALLAENDVELSDDALQAVSGGCSNSDQIREQGDNMYYKCPECGGWLYYWEQVRKYTTDYQII